MKNPSPEPIDLGTTVPSGFSQSQGDPGVKTSQTAINVVPGAKDSLSFSKSGLPQSSRNFQKPIELPISSPLQSPVKTKGQLLAAQLTSYHNLRRTIQQQYPNIKEQAVIRETISTEKSALQGTVLGRLVVDADGKVLDIKFEDQLISPDLQRKTREFFNANPPKGDKKISSYPFDLHFKNNNSGVATELKSSPLKDSEKTSVPQPEHQSPIPESVPKVSSNSPSTLTTESAQKLIQQLRQAKQLRESAEQKP
jgi:hypothetical protein